MKSESSSGDFSRAAPVQRGAMRAFIAVAAAFAEAKEWWRQEPCAMVSCMEEKFPVAPSYWLASQLRNFLIAYVP